MEIMLLDSAKLQEEEALYAKRKGYSKHENPMALYTEPDAKAVMPLLKSFGYDQPIKIHKQVEIIYRDAGHLLGSAITEVLIQGDRQLKKLVFSGDIGRYQQEMLYPPSVIEQADILFVESTYGNKDNTFDDPPMILFGLPMTLLIGEGYCLFRPLPWDAPRAFYTICVS
jgi:metallo-beta-lactamase family protein